MNNSWKKQFITIYIGQAFSLLGSAAVQFAVIWWLTVQTESAAVLTLSTIVAILPNVLIGPFAGVWIDRLNRRTVMIAADGLVALSSAILGIAFLLTETPPIWFVYMILFLRGLGNTFHGPAMRAAIPTLVPADMLVKAGGWGNLVSSISDMIGPVLGAALMGFFPIAGIMLVDILGAAFAIICLLFVTIPDIPRSVQSSSFLSDFKLGIRAMRDNKAFIAVFLPMILVNTLYMPLGSLFPLLVKAHFMGNSWHNSMILFTFAGGTLVGSAVMGTWGGMKRRFLMASFAIGILGGCSLLGGALPSSGIWIFALCSFLMGVTGTFISIPVLAFIQESFVPEVLGKVFSLWITTMSIAMPLGLLMAGSISDMIGIDRWFIFSGIVLMATALLFRMLTNPYDKSGQA